MTDTPKTPVRGVDYDTDTSSMRGFASGGFNALGPDVKPAPAVLPKSYDVDTSSMRGFTPGVK